MVLWDTDGDHLSDGAEDKNRNGKYDIEINESDPLFPDHDRDGIKDSEDVDIDNDGMYNDFEDLFELDKYDSGDAINDDDADGFSNLREYLGDDNNPGNSDWSDPNDPLNVPDLPPKVKFSQNMVTEEANQTIVFDQSLFNVTDGKDDYTAGLKYTWIYGDGNQETDTVYDPTKYKKRYDYDNAGDYELKLQVKDQHGNIGDDSIQVVITVPIGETTTIYDINPDDEEYNDKRTLRRHGWIAYKIKNTRVNEKITIEFDVLNVDEDVGVRVFVIPAKNLGVYRDNEPQRKRISRDYNEYWRGHLGEIARDGKIEITSEKEEDILVIFDNGYYEEYSDTVLEVEPIEMKVKITREESPLFFMILVIVLVVILVSALVGAYFYSKLREDKGMTKITREAAIETQRSLDREMAQLEMEIRESLTHAPARGGGAMTAMPMQRQAPPPQQRPPQQIQQTAAAAPGTVPRTPAPAQAPAGGAPAQVPGAAPRQTQTPGPAPQAGSQQQMLPPGQAPKKQA
jgi:hypothetical protein